jgi:hypothetical protein
MVTVECDDCMVTTWTYGDAHEAIAAWSRRASPDDLLLLQAAEALESCPRFDIGPAAFDDEGTEYLCSPQGEWVRYADVAAALRQRIGRGK